MAAASVRFVPCGPPAREAVAEAIAAVKHDDALAPVTVAVPNNYTGLSLRRWLASSGLPGGDRAGIANVRFMALARVTELLGAPRLAAEGRSPLLAPFRAEAVRATVAANPGPFGDIAQLRPTLQSIDASFRDLRQASEAGLDTLARINVRSGHMVELFRDFVERTAVYYDDNDLARAASDAIQDSPAALAALGTLIVFLPSRLPPAQRAFVDAVLGHGRGEVIVSLTGDSVADDEARGAWDPKVSVDAVEQPSGRVIVSVADPEEEVREVVRRIGACLGEGMPLHRIAVVYRNESPYRLIAAEQLSAAGIPWNGPATSTLAQTLAGRALLGFLDLQRDRFSHEAMAEWLGAAPIVDPGTGRLAQGHLWMKLARRAGVARGAGQWDERLDRYADSMRIERDAVRRRDEDSESRVRHIDHELASVDSLRAFVGDVHAHAKAGDDRSWAGISLWADGVLDRYLRAGADWPVEEEEALRAVKETLAQLAGLDALEGTPDMAVFRSTVEQALERPSGRTGNFGDGVFVGRLADVAGLDLDLVFVLGMTEGSFPPTPREDPLIRDDERDAAGLPRVSARAIDEQRQYLAALSSAEDRVLLFPRADLRGQRAKMPSQWLLETASLLAGERVFASEIERFADRRWLDSLPSFESAVLGDGEPAHLQEFDTRSLRRWQLSDGEPGDHYLVRADSGFAAGFDLQHGRTERGFTRWAGKVDASEGRSPFGGAPLSATALQEWAACPFRYFAGRVLKVEEPDEEDDDIAISALRKGSLIHEILDRFFAGVPRRTEPVQTWTDEDRALLQRVARDAFREAEEDGTVGHPFVWRTERERILADLDQFLDKDEKLRTEFGTVQTSSELAFGFEGGPELAVEVSDGKALKLRGRIDRIDEGEGNRIVVVDYKTGSVKPTAKALSEDPVVAGTYLQLSIYAAAVADRSESSPVDSYYWFVTTKGNFVRRGYAVGARHQERLREVLEVIGTGIEEGTFPQNPGDPDVEDRDNCRNCPFDRLCPASRRATWRRARSDNALKGYVALAQYGASDD